MVKHFFIEDDILARQQIENMLKKKFKKLTKEQLYALGYLGDGVRRLIIEELLARK